MSEAPWAGTNGEGIDEGVWRELAFVRAVTENMGEGLYATDPEGCVTLLNPSGERILGWTQEELRGKDMHRSVHFQHADGTPFPRNECALLEVIRRGEVYRSDHDVFTRKDGTTVPVAYVSSPILHNGAVLGAVVAFHDISEQVDLAEQKAAFLSAAAHDLRTPLTTVRGVAQLLRRRMARGTAQPDAIMAGLDQIDEAAGRMTRLIGELVEVSRGDGDIAVLHVEDLDLVVLVRQVTDRMQAATETHTLTFTTEDQDIWGCWDATRLERVVNNLLSNAVKYSPHQSPVEVTVRRWGDEAVITVRDQGMGIPESELPRIFQRFYRGRAAQDSPGTGIGLASARQQVERHGGSISVQSSEGAGSTFTVRLPLRAPSCL